MKKYLKLSLFAIFLVVPCGLFFFLMQITTELDFSTKPIYQSEHGNNTTSIYLVSYAEGPNVFLKNRNMLTFSAINRGIDFIYNYRRAHLSPEFIQKNPILNEKTGAGFWLWKPYLILKTLQSIPEGAMVIYTDSALFFRQPIRDFMEDGLAKNDVMLFAYDPKEHGLISRSATGDTFAAVGCMEDRCRFGYHVWAGLIALRNSPHSRAFIARWLKLCENPDLLTGTHTKIKNFPEFSHHLHDEAILSVLGAKETNLIRFVKIDKDLSKIFAIHRRKNEEISLLDDYMMTGPYLQRKFFKSKLIRKIRSLLRAPEEPST